MAMEVGVAIDKSQYPVGTNFAWEQNPVTQQKEEVPAWVDYVNPDGSWHINYSYYSAPKPTDAQVAQQQLAVDRNIVINPAQGMFQAWMPSFDQMKQWRPQWLAR